MGQYSLEIKLNLVIYGFVLESFRKSENNVCSLSCASCGLQFNDSQNEAAIADYVSGKLIKGDSCIYQVYCCSSG